MLAERRDRPNSWKTCRGWGAFGALVVVALLVIPIASAKGVVSGTHKAPFHGTQDLGSLVVSSGCGGFAGFSVPPAFNLSKGIGVMSANSSVTGCGPPGFADYGATVGIVGFDTNAFTMGTPADDNLSFVLNWSYTYNLNATPQNPAGGPFAWAAAQFLVFGYLYDVTNSTVRSWCGTGNILLTTNHSASGHKSGGGTGPFACYYYQAGLTVPGHSYVIQMYAEEWEWAYAPSGTPTHATAKLNAGTSGHHFKPISWGLKP